MEKIVITISFIYFILIWCFLLFFWTEKKPNPYPPRIYASVANIVSKQNVTESEFGETYLSSEIHKFPSYRRSNAFPDNSLYGKNNEEILSVNDPSENSYPQIKTKEGCKDRCEANVNCNAFQYYPGGFKTKPELGQRCMLLSVIANPNGDPIDLETSSSNMITYWRK
jgi:hypothetical protein